MCKTFTVPFGPLAQQMRFFRNLARAPGDTPKGNAGYPVTNDVITMTIATILVVFRVQESYNKIKSVAFKKPLKERMNDG